MVDKYLDLASELKMLGNIGKMMIPIVIGSLKMILEVLIKTLDELEIAGQSETIQTTALLSSTRILGRVLENGGDLLLLKLQYETISK